MRSYNHGRFQQQASFLRRQFLQDGDLPFTDVLSEGIVAQALSVLAVRRIADRDQGGCETAKSPTRGVMTKEPLVIWKLPRS